MQTIDSIKDLERYGIVMLTAESCGLGYRILYDLTDGGKKIMEKCLGCELKLVEPWNHGADDNPHIGSILFPNDMLVPIGVFSLLESGCHEVWLYQNKSLLGIEPSDTPERIEQCRRMAPEAFVRTFRYGGTAGDRNIHQMTGRRE